MGFNLNHFRLPTARHQTWYVCLPRASLWLNERVVEQTDCFLLFSLLLFSSTPLNLATRFHPPVSPQKDPVRLAAYFPSDSFLGSREALPSRPFYFQSWCVLSIYILSGLLILS